MKGERVSKERRIGNGRENDKSRDRDKEGNENSELDGGERGGRAESHSMIFVFFLVTGAKN